MVVPSPIGRRGSEHRVHAQNESQGILKGKEKSVNLKAVKESQGKSGNFH